MIIKTKRAHGPWNNYSFILRITLIEHNTLTKHLEYPLITKELLKEASACVSYSNEKLKKAIGYKFASIEIAILKTAKFYIN